MSCAADLSLNTLPSRRLQAKDARPGAPLVLFLHGGNFCSDASDDDQRLAQQIADAGATVVALDYPKAPQQVFPHSLQASFDALRELARRATTLAGDAAPLVVAGAQAGGNLAATLALMARDQHGPALAGQVLISPLLDPNLCGASLREAAGGAGHCPYATGWRDYLASPAHADHPYAAPLSASRLAGLPPALLLTHGADPLRDDARRYALRLRGAQVPSTLTLLPDAAASVTPAVAAFFTSLSTAARAVAA